MDIELPLRRRDSDNLARRLVDVSVPGRRSEVAHRRVIVQSRRNGWRGFNLSRHVQLDIHNAELKVQRREKHR